MLEATAMFRSAFLCRPPNCFLSSISMTSTPRHHHHFPSSPSPSILRSNSHFPRPIIAYAGDNDIDQVQEDTNKPSSGNDGKTSKSNGPGDGDDDDDDDLREEGGSSGRSPFLSKVNWVRLLLDPDPDNVIAVGLTGLLTWASVSVLWQLFTISLAILVAALKYSFIAALLIFILITLL